MPGPFLDQLLPDGIGEQAGVLADHEQMDQIIFCRCFFNQILMPQGKGIGIHDNSCHFGRFHPVLGQPVQVTGKTVLPVLHEDDLIFDPGNLIEPQVTKKFGGTAFGIQEKVEISPFILVLDQMGYDLVHQPFPLVVMVHGHAAQGIAKAAAGGNGPIVIVKHHTGIVQIGIPADPFLLQQSIHLGIGPFIGRIYLGNKIIRHHLSPSSFKFNPL